MHGLGAVLGDQALGAPDQGGDVAAGAADVLGVGPHRGGDLGLGGAGRPGGDPAERPGQAGERDGHDGGAAAVDRGGRHRLAGQVGEGVGHEALERVVGVAVGGQVPAVEPAGGEHRRVLARAVLRQGAGGAAGGDPDVALVGVVGQVGGVLQVGLGEPCGGEHVAHAVEVERLGRVAGAGQGQVLGGQGEPGPQHRHGLDRLVRRAREDRVVGRAPGVQQGAVRAGHRDAGAVHRLHDATAGHVGDHRGVGQGRRGGCAAGGRGLVGHGPDPIREGWAGGIRAGRRAASAAGGIRASAIGTPGTPNDRGRASRPRSSGVSPGKGGTR